MDGRLPESRGLRSARWMGHPPDSMLMGDLLDSRWIGDLTDSMWMIYAGQWGDGYVQDNMLMRDLTDSW